jgi:hypothetical protein
MELKKEQKAAIVRKIVAQLEQRKNEAVNKVLDKVNKQTKLTSEESERALEDARMYKAQKSYDKALKAAGVNRYTNFHTEVADALELSAMDAEDLHQVLANLSKTFNLKIN